MGSLVSANADEIRDIAAFYNAKQAELSDVRAGLGKLSEAERAKMRMTRQLAELDRRVAELQAQLDAATKSDSQYDAEMAEAEAEYQKAKEECDELEGILNSIDPTLLAEIQNLVELNETAKKEEKTVKADCETEYASLVDVRDELRKRVQAGVNSAGLAVGDGKSDRFICQTSLQAHYNACFCLLIITRE